jgi:hypothetical protein
MKTIKGTLKDLKIIMIDPIAKTKKLVFSLDNICVELNTNKCLNAKNGDQVIVAGVDERNEVFTAYSYKKIS